MSDGKLYVVTTKAVEKGDEVLLPYGDGWKTMLPLLTPEFRSLVIDRYKYPDIVPSSLDTKVLSHITP